MELPEHCKWTAQRSQTSCGKGQRGLLHQEPAGRKLIISKDKKGDRVGGQGRRGREKESSMNSRFH